MKKPKQRCRICGKAGHNARSCSASDEAPAKAKRPKPAEPADVGEILAQEHEVALAAREFVRLARTRHEDMWTAMSALGEAVTSLEELDP